MTDQANPQDAKSKIGDLLVEVQRLGIELEELHKDNSRLIDEQALLREAVKTNADLYRRDMQYVIDEMRDALTADPKGRDIHSVYAEAQSVMARGRLQLKRVEHVHAEMGGE